MYIVATGGFHAQISDNHQNLKPALAEHCRASFRRIDRFIQLSLLGAAKCVGERQLDPHCGIYLSAAKGSITNSIKVLEQIFDNKYEPKPLHFIHTLGNSACFYLANNFQINSTSQCISRGDESFSCALELALADLQLGVVEMALVGGVEECPLPLSDQYTRLGISDNRPLQEASYWVLLSKNKSNGAMAITHTIQPITDKTEFATPAFAVGNTSKDLNAKTLSFTEGYSSTHMAQALHQKFQQQQSCTLVQEGESNRSLIELGLV